MVYISEKPKITLTVLSVLLAFALTALTVQLANAEKHRKKVEEGELRAFYELTENLEKADSALLCAALASDSYQLIKTAAAVRECAAFIVSDLAELYAGEEGAQKITAFLNQASDFSRAAALKHADASPPTEEEAATFLMLSEFAEKLKNALVKLRDEVSSGEMSLSEAGDAVPVFGDSVSETETEEFAAYEGLYYEGPFSEHMLLSDEWPEENEVSCDEALKTALALLDGKVVLTPAGETSGAQPAYIFVGDGNNAGYYVATTKKGGHVLSLTSSGAYGEPSISATECETIALLMAQKAGFSDLAVTDCRMEGAVATLTLTATEDGVILYPDSIKIQIARDKGTLVGLSAASYIENHKKRSLPEAKITAEEAILLLSKDFIVEEIKKAVISTDYKAELFCYEISGKFNKRSFLVYINALTGRQEKIIEKNSEAS